MKDFYTNHKKLCWVIIVLLFATIFRMCMYERRYYCSENRMVITNRITNNSYWYRVSPQSTLKDKWEARERCKNMPDTEIKFEDLTNYHSPIE